MEQIFKLNNLNCAHCASVIEGKLRDLDGVSKADFTMGTKQLRIIAAETDTAVLQKTIQAVCDATEDGVVVEPFVRQSKKEMANAHHDHEHNSSLPAIIIAAIVMVLVEFTSLIPANYEMPLLIIAFLIVGWRVLWTAIRNIFKGNIFDENFLMTIATVGAIIIGELPEAVGVMLFFQIGTYFEEKATESSRHAVMEAVDLRPEEVRLINADGTVSIAEPEDVHVGAHIEILPGDRIPLDGKVIEGSTRINTAAVTGEAVPVSAKVGSEVMSGCINETGRIVLEVTHELKDSMVMRILDAVENAAASKPKIDRFITRFSKVYTPIVVVLAIAVAIIPSLVTGNWEYWIYTALTFLVISCPCALVLSVPLAFFSGIGAGSRNGIIFKGGKSIEAMSNVKAIAFDKTGTITTGEFMVQAVEPREGVESDELLALAAAVESKSNHPIAVSIVDSAKAKNIDIPAVTDMEEISGHGLMGMVNGSHIMVGNSRLLALKEITYAEADNNEYGTEVFVVRDGQHIGTLIIADALKDDTVAGIKRIHSLGYETAMFTGDVPASANYMAKLAGIKNVFASLLPQDKLDALRNLRSQKGASMFVGDGINDAPVLSGADVGGAMGSGADAAIEAADVVYMRPSIQAVATSLGISKRTLSIAWQNIIFAIAIKVLVMIAGLFGFANMWVAVFADTGVSILCILNSIRIFYYKD